MSPAEIIIAVALKGALLTFLRAKGIIPSPEEFGKRKRQEAYVESLQAVAERGRTRGRPSAPCYPWGPYEAESPL